MPGDILKTKKNPYNPYRCCVARLCTNTTVKTPEKLWISIPTDIEKRVTWLKLAGRDPDQLSANSCLYLCEDHFDLENDMENYMRYKIMGSVKTVRIKPHHAPSRFDCWIQNGQSTSKPQLAEKQNMVDITAPSCIEDSHADVNNFRANNRNVPSVQITQAQERNKDAHYKCVCCLMVLVKEKVRTLWQEQIVNGEMKIYGNMLADCFAFIWNKPEPSLAARDFICTCCIQRLEEAVSFKHQVMVSQQLINNMTFKSERHVMIKTENQDTNIETDLRYDFIKVEATDPNDFNVDCIKKEPNDPDDFNVECIKKEATDPNDFNDDCENSDVNSGENICDNMCEVKVELEIDDNYDNSDGKSDGNYCEDIDEVHKDEDNPHGSNVEISVKVEDTTEGQPSVTDTSKRKATDKENISRSNTQHSEDSEDTLEADQNAACPCIEQIWLAQQSSIGDDVTEDHFKQMEVNNENPTIDHRVQDSGQIIRIRLNRAPKTTAQRVREYGARQALLKQSKQQEPDVKVAIATNDEKGVTASPVSSQKKPKTAAERMREYRARKKKFSNTSGHNEEQSDLRDYFTLNYDDITKHKKAHVNIDRKLRKNSCTGCNRFRFKNDLNKAPNNYECLMKKNKGSIGDVVTEHDIKQMEVNNENPTIDHRVQDSGQIIRLRLNRAPKTTAQRVREYRARQALRKQQTKQQEPDVIEIATKDEKCVSESSQKHAKTVAQRMREYRARKKKFSNTSGHTEEQSDLGESLTLEHDDITKHKNAPENFDRKFRKNPFVYLCTGCNKFWFKNDFKKASNNYESLLQKNNECQQH